MSENAPFILVSVPEKVKMALVDFFRSLGRDIDPINDDTDLIQDIRASSDEGVDFVLDLVDVLGVDVPDDFNPFVHPSGKRGMKFRELIKHAEHFVAASNSNRGDHANS